MKIVIGLLLLAYVANAKILPDYVSKYACKRTDPNLNDCLLENLRKAIPELADKGIPELEFRPLDPLKIPFMTATGDYEAIQVKMVLKNTTLYGWKDVNFKSVKFDADKLTGEVFFNLPYCRMTTDYYSTGRLFVIPLENSAYFDGNFTDVEMGIKFNLGLTEKKGINYFTVDKLIFKGIVDTAHINITAHDQTLQPTVQVLQDFFNENTRLVLDTVNPLFRVSAADFFKLWLDQGFRSLPADEILPK